MPSTTVSRGNVLVGAIAAVPLTPAIVAPNTSAEQTFTVTGLNSGDFVSVSKPTAQAGLALGNVRVSAVNTLAITFANLTAATITPTAGESYLVQIDRPESTPPANFA